jgi:hypothetical protein
MTIDDLPFLDGHESPPTANGAKGAKPCRRHSWRQSPFEGESVVCWKCGKPKDATASRRGRTNASRGKAIQRKRIEGLGGTNLAGNNPNLDGIGELFRYESKSGGSFSERYWRWLRGIPKGATQVGVLIVTDTPGPGHRARSIVVVDYDDWRDLHGELGPDAA